MNDKFIPNNNPGLIQLLTRQDMHEDCGEFVYEQHGRMICDGQQQKENYCCRTRQRQGESCSEKICKPSNNNKKKHVQ